MCFLLRVFNFENAFQTNNVMRDINYIYSESG